MSESPGPDVLAKAIKALTIAVWCLCIVALAQLAFYVSSYIRSMRFAREMASSAPSVRSGLSKTTWSRPENERPFHELPPEQMVARSSVILLTTYVKDGKRYKAIVAEILKQDPNVTLYYSVGDEYPTLSYFPKDGESCGEGQVVFLVGSPASMRSSYSFAGGRITGLGDMPLTTLREMIKRKKS